MKCVIKDSLDLGSLFSKLFIFFTTKLEIVLAMDPLLLRSISPISIIKLLIEMFSYDLKVSSIRS